MIPTPMHDRPIHIFMDVSVGFLCASLCPNKPMAYKPARAKHNSHTFQRKSANLSMCHPFHSVPLEYIEAMGLCQ